MTRKIVGSAILRKASESYAELYNKDGLEVYANKSGRFEVVCGSTHTVAHSMQDVVEKINGLELHQFPRSGEEVVASIGERLGEQYRLEIYATKGENKSNVVHSVQGSKPSIADRMIGSVSLPVKDMVAGRRYAMQDNMFGGEYAVLVPLSLLDLDELSPGIVPNQLYEPQVFSRHDKLVGIDPVSNEVIHVLVEEAYPNGTFKTRVNENEYRVFSTDDIDTYQLVLDEGCPAKETDFREPDESLYQSEDIPSYNPTGEAEELVPMLGNLKNYEQIMSASAGILKDFMKTAKKVAYIDKSSLNKINVTAVNANGEATEGSIEWNVRIGSPHFKRSSQITIPMVMKEGNLDLGKEFIVSTGLKRPLTVEALKEHLGAMTQDDPYIERYSSVHPSTIHADADIDALTDGVEKTADLDEDEEFFGMSRQEYEESYGTPMPNEVQRIAETYINGNISDAREAIRAKGLIVDVMNELKEMGTSDEDLQLFQRRMEASKKKTADDGSVEAPAEDALDSPNYDSGIPKSVFQEVVKDLLSETDFSDWIPREHNAVGSFELHNDGQSQGLVRSVKRQGMPDYDVVAKGLQEKGKEVSEDALYEMWQDDVGMAIEDLSADFPGFTVIGRSGGWWGVDDKSIGDYVEFKIDYDALHDAIKAHILENKSEEQSLTEYDDVNDLVLEAISDKLPIEGEAHDLPVELVPNAKLTSLDERIDAAIKYFEDPATWVESISERGEGTEASKKTAASEEELLWELTINGKPVSAVDILSDDSMERVSGDIAEWVADEKPLPAREDTPSYPPDELTWELVVDNKPISAVDILSDETMDRVSGDVAESGADNGDTVLSSKKTANAQKDKLIKGMKDKGMKTASQEKKGSISDLVDEADREEVARLVGERYTSGQLTPGDDSGRQGSWEIKIDMWNEAKEDVEPDESDLEEVSRQIEAGNSSGQLAPGDGRGLQGWWELNIEMWKQAANTKDEPARVFSDSIPTNDIGASAEKTASEEPIKVGKNQVTFQDGLWVVEVFEYEEEGVPMYSVLDGYEDKEKALRVAKTASKTPKSPYGVRANTTGKDTTARLKAKADATDDFLKKPTAMQKTAANLVGNLGDVNPFEHGGFLIYDDGEAAFWREPTETESMEIEDATYQVYRFQIGKDALDDLSWISEEDLKSMGETMDRTPEEYHKLSTSEDILDRARVYEDAGQYYGFENLDGSPDMFSYAEMVEMYGKDVGETASKKLAMVSIREIVEKHEAEGHEVGLMDAASGEIVNQRLMPEDYPSIQFEGTDEGAVSTDGQYAIQINETPTVAPAYGMEASKKTAMEGDDTSGFVYEEMLADGTPVEIRGDWTRDGSVFNIMWTLTNKTTGEKKEVGPFHSPSEHQEFKTEEEFNEATQGKYGQWEKPGIYQDGELFYATWDNAGDAQVQFDLATMFEDGMESLDPELAEALGEVVGKPVSKLSSVKTAEQYHPPTRENLDTKPKEISEEFMVWKGDRDVSSKAVEEYADHFKISDENQEKLLDSLRAKGHEVKKVEKTTSSKVMGERTARGMASVSDLYKPGMGAEAKREIESYDLANLETEPGRYEIFLDTMVSGAAGQYQGAEAANILGITQEIRSSIIEDITGNPQAQEDMGVRFDSEENAFYDLAGNELSDKELLAQYEFTWEAVEAVADKIADELNASEKVPAPYDNGQFYFGNLEADGSYGLFYGWEQSE